MQQRYVVVAMMFLSMTLTFLLRMSFPIVLTQMVYIPNINEPHSNHSASTETEIICPVKYHMINNNTNPEPDPMSAISVIETHAFLNKSIKLTILIAQFNLNDSLID